jgi:hypothetical protein
MDVVNEEIDFKEREIRSNHKVYGRTNEIKLKLEIHQKATFISDKKGKCDFEQFNFKCH